MTAYPPGGGSSSRSSILGFPRMADAVGGPSKRAKLDSNSSPHKPDRKGRKSNGEKNPNPLISPTEKCKVCFEPAAKHIHYGAVTCFSCRAFFRRSIQNQSCEAYKCRKQGQCEINLKTRKSCQKCRFDKCLEVGMKSSWVLSEEERHRRFRKHREKLQTLGGQGSTSGNGHSPPSGHNYPGAGGGDSDEEYDNRGYHYLAADYSPRSAHSSGGFSGQNSPSYVSPRPLSPLSAHHHLAITGPSVVVAAAAAAAAKIQLLPGMTFNALRNQGMGGSYVPPSHFLAMAQDPSLFGALSLDPNMPGPSHPEASGSRTFVKNERMEQGEGSRGNMDNRANNDLTDDEDDYNSDDERPNLSRPPKLFTEITPDEISQIKAIARIHDINYESVNFGEELIKEMVMSSVFGVPLSVNATMTAYRLMIQRVTKVAQGFDPFINLPHTTQSALLKNNADMIVSLRGAVFFEKRKGGLDQILITMGVDDLMAARNMVTAAMRTTELKRIDYQTFNSLQRVDEKSETENRYNMLLQRVGDAVSFDPDLVKMLSYVLLFSIDFMETDQGVRKTVESTQDSVISMMQRYIYAQYAHKLAVKHFSRLIHSIADLRGLTHIKKNRQLATSASHIASNKVMTDKPATFFDGPSTSGGGAGISGAALAN